MRLRITFRNHIKVLSFFLLTTIGLVAVLIYLDKGLESSLVGFGFYFIFIVPSFVIHVIYWVKNWEQEIEITQDSITLWDKGGVETKYRAEELEKIILYKAASLEKRGVPFSAMEYYHYARVIPKQGKKIVITCLMAPDVEEAVKKLKGVPIEKRRNIFFTIP